MAYRPAGWNGGIDTGSGQILAQGYQSAADKIGKGLESLATKREMTQTLDSSWDVLKDQYPDLTHPYDEKFVSGSMGAKQGFITGVLAASERAEKNKTVVPQVMNFPGGGRGVVNPRTGSAQPLRDFEPPLPEDNRPVDSGIPGPDGGNILVNPRTGDPWEVPKPAPVKEWKLEEGVYRHYVDGQPSGAMYKATGKPGMVELEGAPGDYIKTGPDGSPMDGGRTYRRRFGPYLPGTAPFDPVPDERRAADDWPKVVPVDDPSNPERKLPMIWSKDAKGQPILISAPLAPQPDAALFSQPPAESALEKWRQWNAQQGTK